MERRALGFYNVQAVDPRQGTRTEEGLACRTLQQVEDLVKPRVEEQLETARFPHAYQPLEFYYGFCPRDRKHTLIAQYM